MPIACMNCKYSKQNNQTHTWCHQIDECGNNHTLFERYDNPYRTGYGGVGFMYIPQSVDSCECYYPNTDDIPEGTCERCGLNKPGGACGHRPKKKEDIVPVIGSRFYTPIVEEGMHDTEPIVFDVEG